MIQRLTYSLLFMTIFLNGFASDEINDLLSVMKKYTSTDSIVIKGISSSFIANKEKPVMNSTFIFIKQNGDIFYEDKYHTMFIRNSFDIWIDHSNKQIYISYKKPDTREKKKSNKFINPSSIFEFVKVQIKDCVSKVVASGKEYTITYKPTYTDCRKSIIEIDTEENLKSIEYYFSTDSYLSKTFVKYTSITTETNALEGHDESKYVLKSGSKWIATSEYKNYKVQIFDYEELF